MRGQTELTPIVTNENAGRPNSRVAIAS